MVPKNKNSILFSDQIFETGTGNTSHRAIFWPVFYKNTPNRFKFGYQNVFYVNTFWYAKFNLL